MRFMSFSSGSCGNCYYIESDGRSVLVDAGVSLRKVKKTLEDYGIGFDTLDGILITHDHFDHIRHLGSFCKRLQKPVYATEMQHKALARHSLTVPYIHSCRRELSLGEETKVGVFTVMPFEVPHDAAQTVGYVIDAGNRRLVIMTDVGRMTDEAVDFLQTADTVVVESNYDMDMLMGGPYTYDLKMRIVRGHGHLSNDECASAVRRFWHAGLKNIFLCHLSENNNTADLAYKASAAALDEINVSKGSVNLRCLPRQNPSPLFEL